MSGAFVHWMVAEQAIAGLPEKSESRITLGRLKNFVSIGAVGPDYPYMSELEGNLFKIHSWADRMHFENALPFVQSALRELIRTRRNGAEPFKIRLSWLCGFVSHLLTDVIIHPVVNAIVGGPCVFTSHEHMICEMAQDTHTFYSLKGIDISTADYVGLFSAGSDPEDVGRIHPAIRDFWTEVLKASHPGGQQYFDKINPDKWHKAYLRNFELAQGTEPIFRHIGEALNIVYKKYNALTTEELEKYINNISLPRRRTNGTFREQAFNKAVAKTVEVWQEIFEDVAAKDSSRCSHYLANWNLDTGVDQDAMYFWS